MRTEFKRDPEARSGFGPEEGPLSEKEDYKLFFLINPKLRPGLPEVA